MDASTLAARVIARRLQLGWRKEDLAQRARLHLQHLYNIENGTRSRLTPTTICALARALGVSTDYLLGFMPADEWSGHLDGALLAWYLEIRTQVAAAIAHAPGSRKIEGA